MIADEAVAVRERYRRDGFYVCPEPVLPGDMVEQAVAGMDAVRAGEYDTGRPPRPSSWNPGDDPKDDATSGLTSFIDDPGYCPVIFGDAGLLTG